jgi:hypothetical protein
LNDEYIDGLMPLGVVKLFMYRSADLDISFDRCSKTYRPLAVVSLIADVLVVLTTPLTRKATTATMSRQATPSATVISTRVIPCGGFFLRRAPLRLPELTTG